MNDEEHIIQVAVIDYCKVHPILIEHLYAIPNGGLRNPKTGHKLKLEGVKRGVSDLFLSFPCKGFHGYYIEMKTPKAYKKNNHNLSEHQLKFSHSVKKVGYKFDVMCDAYNTYLELCYYMGIEPNEKREVPLIKLLEI